MTVVVAAAIVDGDPPRLLAAQRSYPPALAGRWELPGGKVDTAEAEPDALVRECAEELGVHVHVVAPVAADVVTTASGAALQVWWTRLVSGVPHPHEHAQLRWLGVDELDDVEWLEPDLPVIAAIRAAWPGPPAS